ncbi:MAG: histidine--tRNA ligase [Chloroflexota bacterium]
MPKFSTPRGTHDILPDDWPYWDFVLGHALEVAGLFGYQRIQTPNLGETSLFARTSGAGTDVVDKEMYTFLDRGGDELSLRPEGTAPVMRAYLQHGMDRWPQPVKLFYIERMYRYDAPQRGRFREHTQFGAEAIGGEDAYIDVELIALLDTFYRRIGLWELSLHLNSIGDPHCRPTYLAGLVSYLRDHEDALSPQDRQRLNRNPLRVLDSKEAASQATISAAPHMLDYLCETCRDHWDKLLHGLTLLNIANEVDHRLVRGLDYYTRSVFEFMPAQEGAQATIGAGGRYDALAEAMGARHIPGIGFGSGIERLVLNLKEAGVSVPPLPNPEVYAAHQGEGAADQALLLCAQLRQAGIAADMAFGQRNLKAQMKHADGRNARYATIIGEDELHAGTVTLRDLSTGEQRVVPRAELISDLSSE